MVTKNTTLLFVFAQSIRRDGADVSVEGERELDEASVICSRALSKGVVFERVFFFIFPGNSQVSEVRLNNKLF